MCREIRIAGSANGLCCRVVCCQTSVPKGAGPCVTACAANGLIAHRQLRAALQASEGRRFLSATHGEARRRTWHDALKGEAGPVKWTALLLLSSGPKFLSQCGRNILPIVLLIRVCSQGSGASAGGLCGGTSAVACPHVHRCPYNSHGGFDARMCGAMRQTARKCSHKAPSKGIVHVWIARII